MKAINANQELGKRAKGAAAKGRYTGGDSREW